eukprot:Pgem_evm1s20140
MADSSAQQAGTGEKPAEGERRGRGGFGAGRGRRRGRRGDKDGKEAWQPVTKLGRLVKEKKIESLQDIYLFSLPIKEHQIIEQFIAPVAPNARDDETVDRLKDEVLKIMPVQKQTCAGQRTRFKAFVVVGDRNGHLGLGVKCSKEVATAIRGAIILAKLAVVPIRRGYWGSNFGAPHTIPCKVTGKCGSVRVRLIPAPRGTGIVAAGVAKRLLQFAGVDDCFTSACGKTRTLGNFAKAVYDALCQTYSYLTPDLWEDMPLTADLYSIHSDFLQQGGGLAKNRNRVRA